MRALIAELHPYLTITSGLLILALCFWTLLTPPRKFGKTCFSISGALMGGYLITFGSLSLISNKELALFIGGLGQLFVHQISPWFYLFSVSLFDLKKQKPLAYLGPFVALFLITPMILTAPGMGVFSYWWGDFVSAPLNGVPTWIHVVYFSFFFGLMALSMRNFINAYRLEKNPRKKIQHKHVLTAFSIAYIGSWDHLAWMGFELYPFGYIPLTAYVAVLAYSFIRHKLLDVDVLLKKVSLIFLIYSGLFAVSVPLSLFIFQKGFLTLTSNSPGNLIVLSIFFGSVLSVGPFIYARLTQSNFWLKSRFTEGLTHELKSPLGAIKGSLELLKDQINNPNSDKESMAAYTVLMEKNTTRLENYVKDLLDIAQIKKGEIRLIKAETDFSNLIQSVLEQHKTAAGKSNLTFTFQNGVPSKVACDPAKMRQAVSNLISNAVKFTKEGEVRVGVQREGKGLLVTVNDTGDGISKEDLPYIFESFYQGKKRNKGSGVGLAIAKGWVEAHGGEIWAESEGEGKGTKVSFTIPLKV